MDWLWITNTIRSIDWVTLSNIAVVISAMFIIRQLREMRRTTQAQAYSVAVEHLQDEKVRHARQAVFQLEEKPFENWSREEVENAEIVCHTYDAIGQMVRHKLLSKDMIIDSWGPSLRNSWPILSPLVQKYRRDYDAVEYWDDYEWLAREASKAERWRQTKEQWLKLIDVSSGLRNPGARLGNVNLLARLLDFISRQTRKQQRQ